MSERAETFGIEDSKDGGEGTESKDKGEPEDSEGEIDERNRRYNWLRQVDDVSHTVRITWDEVWSMCVIEFFNIVDYIKERERRKADDIKQWQMRLKH